MEHFVIEYARYINEILHRVSTDWHYRHEIYEVSDVATALVINHDVQRQDQFGVNSEAQPEDFIGRINQVLPSVTDLGTLQDLLRQAERGIIGWRKQTIFFIKQGNHPDDWTVEDAKEDILTLLHNKQQYQPVIMEFEADNVQQMIPTGKEHFRTYEDFVRRAIDVLFLGDLGRATPQARSEPANEDNEGYEIRDLLCQNRAETGFWKDLKDKYSCTEILFEAKNEQILTRSDLRQTYCYLKPALGLWGFIVCRAEQPSNILAYNRTLFSNFAQTRGVLIITDDDIRQMLRLKGRDHDPSSYLRDKMSEFTPRV
jgi:hypothetical protein